MLQIGYTHISTSSFEKTANGRLLTSAAQNQRMVFFTGLPASGKSFLLRQQLSIALSLGRRVRMIRWDTGLAAFDTNANLTRFPNVEDGTHPVIRKAAGLWVRQAVARWEVEHPDPAEMLIGEVPIIGNRYSELVEALEDEAEPMMASDASLFIYPVPTRDVRDRLEAMRRTTFANPAHPDETKDAPPETMDLAWRLTLEKAVLLGLVGASELPLQHQYDEKIYRRFFDYLLKHRNSRALAVQSLHPEGGSAHDLEGEFVEIAASPREVSTAIEWVESEMDPERVEREVANWFRV